MLARFYDCLKPCLPAPPPPNPRSLARWYRISALASRITAAMLGGYALAALTSIAALALPMATPQAVLTGMQSSFAVYAGAVIWVFLARSATRAWAGLTMVAVPLALIAWRVSSAQPAMPPL